MGTVLDLFRGAVTTMADPVPDAPPAQRKSRRAKLRYDGARTSTLTRGWIAASGDAASEIAPDIGRLRDRAREAERNRGLVTRILERFQTAVVGAVGPRPRFLTGDDRLDKEAADLWRRWTPVSSASDRLTFEALVGLCLRATVRDGEGVVRLRARRLEDNLPVPMQLQLLESDHLDTDKSMELANGGRIVNGVETGPLGQVVAYWIRPRHPGDYLAAGTNYQSTRVDAADVLHVYHPTRIGQRRGASWLSPVLDAVWHHTELRRSERVRLRGSACLFASVEGAGADDEEGIAPRSPTDGEEAGASGYVEDADGNPVNDLPMGAIVNVAHGKSLKLHTPQAAIGYVEAVKAEERDIARGVGLMYEAVSGDLSQVNWASYRVGDVGWRAFADFVRAQVLEPMMLRPLIDAWLAAAVASGALRRWPANARVEWRWPPHEEMDRAASAEADRAELANGLTSFEQLCEKRGTTLTDQIASLRRSEDALREAGLTFVWRQQDAASRSAG